MAFASKDGSRAVGTPMRGQSDLIGAAFSAEKEGD
jgi:hypothetical protein